MTLRDRIRTTIEDYWLRPRPEVDTASTQLDELTDLIAHQISEWFQDPDTIRAANYPVADTVAISWHKQLGRDHTELMFSDEVQEAADLVTRAVLYAAVVRALGVNDDLSR
jgi:hypothetical protein